MTGGPASWAGPLPFIEVNGRAQRVWLSGASGRAGFEFKIRPEGQAAWYQASCIGFEAADLAPMPELILARIQSLQLVESDRGSERAAQVLALSREAASANSDGSFQAAWANLDKVGHQIADHLRAGRTIVEAIKAQAWRNPSQDKAPSPIDKDR